MAATVERPNDELSALTRLTLDELGGAVAGIGRIHKAIADRAFGATGPGATAARVIHDAVARNVYGGMRAGTAVLGRGAEAVIGERGPISVAPLGAGVLAAIDGLIGAAVVLVGLAITTSAVTTSSPRGTLRAWLPLPNGRTTNSQRSPA